MVRDLSLTPASFSRLKVTTMVADDPSELPESVLSSRDTEPPPPQANRVKIVLIIKSA